MYSLLYMLASAMPIISVCATNYQGFSEYKQMQPGHTSLQRRSVGPKRGDTVGTFAEVFPNSQACEDIGQTIPIGINHPTFDTCYSMPTISTVAQDTSFGGFTTDATYACDDGLVSAAYFWKTDPSCNTTTTGVDPSVLATGNGCTIRGVVSSDSDSASWVAFKFGCVVAPS